MGFNSGFKGLKQRDVQVRKLQLQSVCICDGQETLARLCEHWSWSFGFQQMWQISSYKHFTRKKLVKCCIRSIALYGAETWTLRAVDQKHLESSEMLYWRRMEKISWTDHVRNDEVLLTVKEQRNILHEISKRKANCIGHILRRNCPLQQVIEGKIKNGYKWQEDDEEDVGSYWMTLRKKEDALIWRRNL